MPIPRDIRAAFPIPFYDNQCACIVTDDIFDELLGYPIIFHEFYHCYQSANGETDIRNTLSISKQAAKNKDYMWELNYPFPYDNKKIRDSYLKYLSIDYDYAETKQVRRALKSSLSKADYEYLIWQEWKEGMARLVENELRKELGVGVTDSGEKSSFDRVSFYMGGEKYITQVISKKPSLRHDIKALFNVMFEVDM